MNIAARRAIVRWSWRLYRREWRQQLLVLVLLTATVAAAVFGAVAARGFVPTGDGEFGTASHRLTLSPSGPDELAATLATLRSNFGPIDVIGNRRVDVPGTVHTVEYRSQDPRGTFSAPMFALLRGRYPSGDEIALTEGVAALVRVDVNGHFALDGVDRRVVGIIENPGDLDDEFALVTRDDPQAAAHDVLVRADDARLGVGLPGSSVRRANGPPGESSELAQVEVIAQRGGDDAALAAAGALALALVVAMLVCLVAAAGFVIVAQRRLRQLGMLAAIGATERHLRLVVLANGALVGAVAAVVGAALAGLGWIIASPRLEAAAGHRLDRYDVPWWIVASGMGLALVTATAAAWWPGRAVARVPITSALSARPPKPQPVHRSAVLAGGLIVAGFVALAVGVDNVKQEANLLLFLPGVAALIVGMLLISPVAIRTLAPLGTRAPIAVKLALRDLARHQARSGVALAAITLALGIAVSTMILTGAAQDGPTEGNLPDRQLLMRFTGSDPMMAIVPAEVVAARRDVVERFAATIEADVVPLEVAIVPDAPETRDGVVNYPIVVLGRPVGDVTRDIGVLYVATAELTEHLGIDVSALDLDTDVVTPHRGTMKVANTMKGAIIPVVERIAGPAYSASPTSLLTPAALQRYGWDAVAAGWLLETDSPLTVAQIRDARELAVAAGLTIETRDEQESLSAVRTWATVAGMALALAILAMTIGLIRGEAASDLRTLTATGATSGTRRTIVAATAGALALLGVVIATGGAYLALIASYLEDLEPLAHVPLAHLLVTAIGVPAFAAGAAWLLAGREPRIARAVVE